MLNAPRPSAPVIRSSPFDISDYATPHERPFLAAVPDLFPPLSDDSLVDDAGVDGGRGLFEPGWFAGFH